MASPAGVVFTVAVCIASCLALVLAEYRGWPRGKALYKLVASTAFVALAWQLGATTTAYGRWILLALVLS